MANYADVSTNSQTVYTRVGNDSKEPHTGISVQKSRITDDAIAEENVVPMLVDMPVTSEIPSSTSDLIFTDLIDFKLHVSPSLVLIMLQNIFLQVSP